MNQSAQYQEHREAQTCPPAVVETPTFVGVDDAAAGGSVQEPSQRAVISESALAKAHTRELLVLRFNDLSQKSSQVKAARAAGEPLATLRRWSRRYAAEGLPGLVDRCDLSGRKSVADLLREACGNAAFEAVLQKVRGLTLDLDSSTGAAWRMVAAMPETPKPIKDYFAAIGTGRRSKHSISDSLMNLTRSTPALDLVHRGPRSFSLRGVYTPRKLDIVPGDVFCSDDTTPIWAWWIPWPKSEEYPFGCKVLQGQLLPIIDVASQCPISFALIAREKSSYRAADIWSLFGHVFDRYGLPRLGVQLERGSWEATLIKGAEVEYQSGEVSHTRRVGGLRMLPTNVLPWHMNSHPDTMGAFPKTLQTFTSYLPKSKSVEAFFHRLQKLEGTLYGCLGRDQMRRPFEKQKHIYEACKRGSQDPRLHFLQGTELASRLQSLMQWYSEDRIEGEVFFGKPSEIWSKGMEEHGPLLQLPETQRYLFRRDWSACTISKGWVKPSRTDETTGRKVSYFYQNPNLFAERDGQQVLVYFDRNDFEAPAQIHALNGDYLGSAEYFQRKGMFLADEIDGHEARRLYAGAVMTIYGSIAPNCPSRQLPTEIAARRAIAAKAADAERESLTVTWQDGRGGVARVEMSPSSTSESAPTDSTRLEAVAANRCSVPSGAVPIGTDDGCASSSPLVPQASSSKASETPRFDYEAAVARADRLEREAIARGDLIAVNNKD